MKTIADHTVEFLMEYDGFSSEVIEEVMDTLRNGKDLGLVLREVDCYLQYLSFIRAFLINEEEEGVKELLGSVTKKENPTLIEILAALIHQNSSTQFKRSLSIKLHEVKIAID